LGFFIFPGLYGPGLYDYPEAYPVQVYPAEAAGHGLLNLDIQPADAEVFLDGEYLGAAGELAGGAVSAGVGGHLVEIRTGGYSEYFSVTVGPGASTYFFKDAVGGDSWEGHAAPSSAAAACPADLGDGVLAVDVAPGQAEVFVNGSSLGHARGLDGAGIVLPEGSHEIRVASPGYAPQIQTVEVRCGEPVELDIELVREG
jgi:hypothetical protein